MYRVCHDAFLLDLYEDAAMGNELALLDIVLQNWRLQFAILKLVVRYRISLLFV